MANKKITDLGAVTALATADVFLVTTQVPTTPTSNKIQFNNLQSAVDYFAGAKTNTHGQIDTHITATSGVHGLSASVSVLGSKVVGSGEFVQQSTSVQTMANNALGSLYYAGPFVYTYPVSYSWVSGLNATVVNIGSLTWNTMVSIGTASAVYYLVGNSPAVTATAYFTVWGG